MEELNDVGWYDESIKPEDSRPGDNDFGRRLVADGRIPVIPRKKCLEDNASLSDVGQVGIFQFTWGCN